MTTFTLLDHPSLSTLEAIRLEKKQLAAERDACGERMKGTVSELFSPAPAAKNRLDLAMNLFQNGFTIFKGVQLGLSVVSSIRSLLGTGRRRRR